MSLNETLDNPQSIQNCIENREKHCKVDNMSQDELKDEDGCFDYFNEYHDWLIVAYDIRSERVAVGGG